MPRFVALRSLVGALVAAPALAGCDLAIAGFLLPGLGRPLTGRVVDARTRLPVGGATVLAGLGQTVTDGQGHFRLFGNFASDEVSVARAGYIAQTQGGIPLSPDGDLAFTLEPLFVPASPLPVRFLQLSGPVTGLASPVEPAMVCLGGTSVGVSNGAYAIEYKAPAPGRILSAVLARGTLSAPWIEGVAAPQPFHFLQFAYEVGSWRLGDTIPESAQTRPVQIASQVPIQPVRVSYSNLGGFGGVQTDVALDFGVLGYVPVARALASSQGLPVPVLAGLKYVVTGEASDAAGKTSSLVTLTTNDPGRATFQLLSVPRVVEPTAGATGVGQRPTFRWTPLAVDVEYEVRVREVGEAQLKWVGRTRFPEITYPGFAANDINGGALRPDRKYTWSLRAIEVLEAGDAPASPRFALADLAGPRVPVRPYRVRKREAEVRDMGFSL
ncbi:MAG: hypothetical protein VKS61_07080 [Candidatus Sericytochromatia bacterium]|nr:hypothetical protein [Candidatus Sericytochromatia bacterium]